MKTRKELLESKGYWIAKLQLDLFRGISEFKKENNLNDTKLAEILNVTKGYVSQILNGNFDHKISKLVELSMVIGKVPVLENLSDFLEDEESDISETGKMEYILRSENETKEYNMDLRNWHILPESNVDLSEYSSKQEYSPLAEAS